MTGTVADTARPTFGTSEARATPPPGMAIEHEPTRQALARHGRRPLGFLAMAAGGAVLGVVLGLVGADMWPFGLSVAVAGLVLAAWQGLRWRWMRRVLRTSPWVRRRGDYHVLGSGRYAHGVLLLHAQEDAPEVLCSVPELRWRLDALAAPGGSLDLWVAGDPRDKGLATVDGADIVPVAQPSWGPWRRFTRWRLDRRMGGSATPPS